MSVASPRLRSRVRAGAEPIARVFGRLGLTTIQRIYLVYRQSKSPSQTEGSQ